MKCSSEKINFNKKLSIGLNKIGTRLNNDIIIDHPYISPSHFHIYLNELGEGHILCLHDQFKISLMTNDFNHIKNMQLNEKFEIDLKSTCFNFIIKDLTFILE